MGQKIVPTDLPVELAPCRLTNIRSTLAPRSWRRRRNWRCKWFGRRKHKTYSQRLRRHREYCEASWSSWRSCWRYLPATTGSESCPARCRHHRPPTHFLRTTRTPLLFGVLVRRFLVTDGEVWERRFGSRPWVPAHSTARAHDGHDGRASSFAIPVKNAQLHARRLISD